MSKKVAQKPHTRRKHRMSRQQTPGAQYSGFIAPPYRRMFLFGAATIAAFLFLIFAGFYTFNVITSFVDGRARSAWAADALTAAQERNANTLTIKDHAARLEKLEQQGHETGKTLVQVDSKLGTLADTLKDIKLELTRATTAPPPRR